MSSKVLMLMKQSGLLELQSNLCKALWVSFSTPPMLGERLRAIRTERGLSLREVERRSGVNSGYLSQLERNEIANPTPSVLQKVARAYDEPFTVLMRWAG